MVNLAHQIRFAARASFALAIILLTLALVGYDRLLLCGGAAVITLSGNAVLYAVEGGEESFRKEMLF